VFSFLFARYVSQPMNVTAPLAPDVYWMVEQESFISSGVMSKDKSRYT